MLTIADLVLVLLPTRLNFAIQIQRLARLFRKDFRNTASLEHIPKTRTFKDKSLIPIKISKKRTKT